MAKRVCIDPGHGGSQPGAIYRGLKEKDVVLTVANYVIEGLHAVDPEIKYLLTRSIDRTVSLQERCDISNAFEPNCFVSIHCNADLDPDSPGDPEAKGEEIWIFKGSLEGQRLAKCLEEGVNQIFPNEPFRGIKETEALHVLKHTNAPAALIEIGFIDKSSSLETFQDEFTLRKIGALIARGIYDFLTDDQYFMWVE